MSWLSIAFPLEEKSNTGVADQSQHCSRALPLLAAALEEWLSQDCEQHIAQKIFKHSSCVTVQIQTLVYRGYLRYQV